MDKVSQIVDAYRVLLDAGRVRNKKEFAALLGRDYTGVVSAMNGNEKFLTDSLVSAAVALAAGSTETPAPEFSPFEVECRHIRGWYRVLMVMSLV